MVQVMLKRKKYKVEKGSPIRDLVKDKATLAARLNGELCDLSKEITSNCELEFITFASDIGKKIFWHSASHIMAMAVKSLFPGAKYAIGPAIDQGFYYDFDFERPFSPEDLEKIEEKMEDEKHLELAWKICNLISELNDLLWDHYEERFIEQQKEEVIYTENLTDHLDNDDF